MKATVLGFLPSTTLVWCLLFQMAQAWVQQLPTTTTRPSATKLHMAEEKMAKQVSGEELELMLTEWEQPLVIDAYATW